VGEIPGDKVKEQTIDRDFHFYSNVAFTFTGIELTHCEVISLGNGHLAQNDFKIAHAPLKDILDIEGIKRVLRKAGLVFTCCLDEKNRSRQRCLRRVWYIPSIGEITRQKTTILEFRYEFYMASPGSCLFFG